MKKYTIMFWIATSLIFIMEGVIPAFTSQSDMAIQGVVNLGYPAYFSGLLAVFKVAGSLALIIPKVSPRIKEWAYAGFGIDFICAFASIWIVMGIQCRPRTSACIYDTARDFVHVVSQDAKREDSVKIIL
jgi:hypothetical protein